MYVLAFYTKNCASVQGVFVHVVYFAAAFRPPCGGLKGWPALLFQTFGKLCDAKAFPVFFCTHAVKLTAGIIIYPFRYLFPFLRRIG